MSGGLGTMAGTEVLTGSSTRTGLVRQVNQDFLGSWEPSDDAELAAKGRLFVVCDGMGGAAGGEIASKLGVETVIARYREDTTGNIAEALKNAIEAANRAIWDLAKAKPELTGMGSTCVALAIKDGTVYVGHDGDSRCYMIRGGELHQLTKDHSMVQQMLDAGIIEEHEVAEHPRKNVIMRCLGVKPEIEVEIMPPKPVEGGDIYYLCTDGLWGLVMKEDAKNLLLQNKDNLAVAAKTLLEAADKNGGTDNSTVSIVHIRGGGGANGGAKAGAKAPAAAPAPAAKASAKLPPPRPAPAPAAAAAPAPVDADSDVPAVSLPMIAGIAAAVFVVVFTLLWAVGHFMKK